MMSFLGRGLKKWDFRCKMNALDTITNIINNENLLSANLKYCYVTKDKVPYKGPCLAHPNNPDDFLLLENLDLSYASKFAGLGVSVQASHICAIDVDHCFTKAFDPASADFRAQEIINLFNTLTYIEFSFSGTGMRILFRGEPIDQYSIKYYIKNSKTQCEYYYPEGSNRYVTITGRPIINTGINFISKIDLEPFLNKYMLRPQTVEIDTKFEPIEGNPEELLKHYIRSNKSFQDNWFEKAPGSGSNESERDFFLIKFMFENITHDPELLKEFFEKSPFYNSKDYKHRSKWQKSENRYFKYLYNVITGGIVR